MVKKLNALLMENVLAVQVVDGVEIQKIIASVKVVWITGEVTGHLFLCFISLHCSFSPPSLTQDGGDFIMLGYQLSLSVGFWYNDVLSGFIFKNYL